MQLFQEPFLYWLPLSPQTNRYRFCFHNSYMLDFIISNNVLLTMNYLYKSTLLAFSEGSGHRKVHEAQQCILALLSTLQNMYLSSYFMA